MFNKINTVEEKLETSISRSIIIRNILTYMKVYKNTSNFDELFEEFIEYIYIYTSIYNIYFKLCNPYYLHNFFLNCMLLLY